VNRAPEAAAGQAAPGRAVFGAAAAAILIWGATPIVTKIAVAEIDPVTVGVLRTALPALVTAPLALALRMRLPRGGLQWRWLVVSALGGFVIFPILFSIGQRYTSASHAGLILAVLPAMTGLFTFALERRRPPGLWWLGVGIAGTGTAALVGLRLGFDGGGEDPLLGDIIILSGCAAVSLGYVAGGRLGQLGYSAWNATFWGIALGGLVLLPALALLGPAVDWSGVSGVSWGSVLYLGLVSSILGYVAWYWALSAGGIGRIGLLQFGLPVVSLVLAVLVLGEALSWPLLAAGAAILAGVFVARRST
jgi:drug/metabolite transporter (DMT)-like permease